MQSHELLGTSLLELGRHEEARAALEVQLGRTPARASIIEGLTIAAEALGDETASN